MHHYSLSIVESGSIVESYHLNFIFIIMGYLD